MTKNACQKRPDEQKKNKQAKRRYDGLARGPGSRKKQESCPQSHPQPTHSNSASTEVSQDNICSGSPTFTEHLDPLLRYFLLYGNDSISKDRYTTEGRSDSSLGACEEEVENQGAYYPYECEEDISQCSTTCSLEETIEQERVKLKRFGYMPEASVEPEESASSSCPVAPPTSVLEAVAEPRASEQGKDDFTTIDTSTEPTAALIWPKCERPCRICQSTHVAVPGSNGSADCIRISMFVANAATSASQRAHHESILIPTDIHELSVLGWLIWSTFKHQLALGKANLGFPPPKGGPENYISIEIIRTSDNDCPSATMKHVKLYSKATLQSWWHGKLNLTKYMGKRWMVITFPWDMGDTDMLHASFGTYGRLFTCPALKSTKALKRRVRRGFRSTKSKKSLESSEHHIEVRKHDTELSGDGEITMMDKRHSKRRNKDLDGFQGLGADIPAQSGAHNPAFQLYREKPFSSSDESSQGKDDDFI